MNNERLVRLHKCAICGVEGEWSESWSWYGSWMDLDDGITVKFCSDDCKNKSETQKVTIYRNRQYLNAAGEENCIRCGRPGETRSSHYNGFRAQSFGKGRGVKCADFMTAAFCESCDNDFSEANYHAFAGGSKSPERSEQFLYFCLKTLERRLADGWKLTK